MTTEDLIEELLQAGYKAYKKNADKSPAAQRLRRHEPIEIDGYTFTYFREYVCYRAVQYIKEICPEVDIELILNGNDSTINLVMSNEEQQLINRKLYCFLEKQKII